MTQLEVRCAWCNVFIGWKDAEGQPPEVTSGICNDCGWKFFKMPPSNEPYVSTVIRRRSVQYDLPWPWPKLLLTYILTAGTSSLLAYYLAEWMYQWWPW